MIELTRAPLDANPFTLSIPLHAHLLQEGVINGTANGTNGGSAKKNSGISLSQHLFWLPLLLFL